MANAFSKEEIVFFEQILMGFDPNNITARNTSLYMAPSTTFERSALQVWRPTPYISITTEGLTLAAAQFTDLTQLSVPSTLNANQSSPSDVINVPFTMNAVELNDPLQRDRKATSAIQALSAKIDNIVATEIAQRGSIFIKDAAAITNYTQVAQCEALMTIRDVPLSAPRTLVMNAIDYNGISGNLANRDAPMTGSSTTAFERSRIPMVGTFESFKANFQPTIQVAAGSGYLINGAQFYTPQATDSAGNNVDNRTMDITVDTGTGTPVAGDAFTIAGVNALSHIHKNDTGELQTFRVVTVNSATSWEITPAIVTNAASGGQTQAELEYANCSAAAADNAAITFLNTGSAKPSNIFWVNDAVEITHGSLATMDLDGAGVATMRESTDSGIEILFAKGSSVRDLGTEYRLVMWANANVLVPEMAGCLIGT